MGGGANTPRHVASCLCRHHLLYIVEEMVAIDSVEAVSRPQRLPGDGLAAR